MTETSKRGMPLYMQMMIGFVFGLVAGLIVYVTAPGAEWVVFVTTWITGPAGQLFLRLLFMLVIPLLFSALAVGIAEMGDLRSLGRVGWKTLVYTIAVSAIAVLIGLVLVNLLRPGDGVDPVIAQQMLDDSRERAAAIVTTSQAAPTGMGALLNIVPSNVIAAAANNDILAVMFFSLFIGIGLVMARSSSGAATLKSALEGLFEVSMKLINMVIRLAPIAVACFMFNLSSMFGWDLLLRLGAYAGVVILALSIHLVVVYSLAVKTLGGMSPVTFFKGIQEAMVMAFATASSNATLPTALRVAEEKLNLPPRVSRFVLTIGATANQNGTALFEGVTVLFLAQFFGVELDLWQQAMVMLVSILGGIGTAGVPAGSLPVVALILAMVGLPPEGIGLILGIDRFLDMCRTTLNVTGDLAAAVVVSRGEKHDPDPEPPRHPVISPG